MRDRAINMMSSETGVRDTMNDLITDTAGAAVVAGLGWAYMKTGRYSFIADGVRAFVDRNPWLFRTPARPGARRARRAHRRAPSPPA